MSQYFTSPHISLDFHRVGELLLDFQKVIILEFFAFHPFGGNIKVNRLQLASPWIFVEKMHAEDRNFEVRPSIENSAFLLRNAQVQSVIVGNYCRPFLRH